MDTITTGAATTGTTTDILVLPHCPPQLPAELQGKACVQVPDLPALHHPDAARQALDTALPRAARPAVQALLASDRTPALLCLLASQATPQAKKWFYQHDSGLWEALNTRTGTAPMPTPIEAQAMAAASASLSTPMPVSVSAPVSVDPSSATPAAQTPASAPAPATTRPPHSNQPAGMSDGALINRAFRLSAWGETSERQRELHDIEREAVRRPGFVLERIGKAKRDGLQAHGFTEPMLSKLKAHGQVHTEQWIAQKTQGMHKSVAEYLRTQLTRELRHQCDLRQRHAPGGAAGGASPYLSGIEPVVLAAGVPHPNSLAHLPPAMLWTVYIDETGERFEDDTDGLALRDRALGRLVALAVPAGTTLPPLRGFHGTEASSAQTDEVVQRLLRSPVGILGFTVHDRSSCNQYWLGHVRHLVRWVLLQLPVQTTGEAPCKVQVLIEQRDNHTPHDDLRFMARVLESELRALDPARFGQLLLTLEFMDKAHPHNGHVDALAFTWGSPAAASRDRLKKSALLGHCLIEVPTDTTHHLYLALGQHGPLSERHWYALCSAASAAPAQGLLARALQRIGADCQGGASTGAVSWPACLAHVQQRLHGKDYRLDELGHALDWLQHHAPEGRHLPAPLQLQLHSARLARANHQGQADAAQLGACLELALQLRDEAPEMACEVLLRLVSATTNHFEFDALQGTVQDWLAQPHGGCGLALRGKLHSSLGQMHAFASQADAAQAAFGQAQACFGRLSDPAQRQREQLQTGQYALIAQLDALTAGPGRADAQAVAAFIADLHQHLHQAGGKGDGPALSRSLAYSGQARRYAHHLWLRALVALPQALAAEREAYVQQHPQWQVEPDHPWPLICAYRAWLLHDAGHGAQAAEEMALAIALCMQPGHGLTLRWMAEVLRALAQHLGLAQHAPDPEVARTLHPGAAEREQLHTLLPHAPHQALARFANPGAADPADAAADAPTPWQQLALCLPFNFH